MNFGELRFDFVGVPLIDFRKVEISCSKQGTLNACQLRSHSLLACGVPRATEGDLTFCNKTTVDARSDATVPLVVTEMVRSLHL
jgi:hypothetical protein